MGWVMSPPCHSGWPESLDPLFHPAPVHACVTATRTTRRIDTGVYVEPGLVNRKEEFWVDV